MAVASANAAQRLSPGDRVVYDKGYVMKQEPAVAIVDPFLTKKVGIGEICHIIMLPGQTQDLRHEWNHPSFLDTEVEKSVQESIDVAALRQKIETLQAQVDDLEGEDDGCRGCYS